MAKPKQQSSLGTFGSIVIALGLIGGFISSSVYVAACGIGAGVGILLYALLIDRLDIIIDLLKQVIEHQPDLPGERDEDEPNTAK